MDIHKYHLNECTAVNDQTSVNDQVQAHRSTRFQPFIVIWENILQFIAGLAFRAGEVETGGELYGLLSHAD